MTEPKTAAVDHPVHELVARRFSPYTFSDRPVSDSDLRSLFEAARWAPSSYNEQPWRYIVARRSEPREFESMLSCLVEGNRAWAEHVPVLALGVTVRLLRRNRKINKAAQHDLGLAAGNLCLEATARGLFVHQMIGILPDRAREIYAIPEDAEALSGLAIGYLGDRAEDPTFEERDRAPRTRRPLREFVFEGSWERPAGFVESATAGRRDP